MRSRPEESEVEGGPGSLTVQPDPKPISRGRWLDWELARLGKLEPRDAFDGLGEQLLFRPPRGGGIEVGPVARGARRVGRLPPVRRRLEHAGEAAAPEVS